MLKSLETARGHIRIGELVAGHGTQLAVSLATIRDLQPQDTARLVRSILASTMRSEGGRNDATWTELWRELREV